MQAVWALLPKCQGPRPLPAHRPCHPYRAPTILIIQNGCQCSSHHFLIPANRKEKK